MPPRLRSSSWPGKRIKSSGVTRSCAVAFLRRVPCRHQGPKTLANRLPTHLLWTRVLLGFNSKQMPNETSFGIAWIDEIQRLPDKASAVQSSFAVWKDRTYDRGSPRFELQRTTTLKGRLERAHNLLRLSPPEPKPAFWHAIVRFFVREFVEAGSRPGSTRRCYFADRYFGSSQRIGAARTCL